MPVIIEVARGANPEAVARALGVVPTHVYSEVFQGFAADLPDLPAYGAGAGLYADVLRADPDFSEEHPDALYLGQFALARLAAGETLLDSTPLYLRESDAQVPGPRKRAL